MHIDIVYAVIRMAFKTQLTLVQSLYNLFRGKTSYHLTMFRPNRLVQENDITSFVVGWMTGTLIWTSYFLEQCFLL